MENISFGNAPNKRGSLVRSLVTPARSRRSFVASLPIGGEVFDVGCGNDSPYQFKSMRADIRYVGLDVGHYNQEHDPAKYADEYLIVPPEGFLPAIIDRPARFDAVISSHNLEHCSDQDGVVTAMARALRPNGRIFLAFPAAATVDLPSRNGTLNFYDDPTHTAPPDYRTVLELLSKEGVQIEFAAERYRSPLYFLAGLVTEPYSRLSNRVNPGTWALYGFETVIWGRKFGTLN